ncbi:M20 family metallo-hydrolase [Xylophilus sp. GW821-FHT01B05]
MSFDPRAEKVAAAVDTERLGRRIAGLAAFGARADGGVDRQALTTEELAARRWLLADVVQRPGYRVGIDDAANVFVQRAGSQPGAAPVLTGSHADTQPAGGRLDGAFGVVAGFELFDALDQAGIQTRRPVEVVIWTNEEGCRFSPGLMGSNGFVDPASLAVARKVRDASGVYFGAACDAARDDFLSAAAAHGWPLLPCPPARPVHAYIEAHIEQGPELEAAQHQVGCVHTIQGVRWLELVFAGRSAHAGTTPAHMRDDAMPKAVRAAQAVLALADVETARDPRLRLTIGRFDVQPGSINTIAREARFTVDLRHPDELVLQALQARIAALCGEAAQINTLLCKPPVAFDTRLHALTLSACAQLGLRHQPMLSGAFHDAMPLASHAPTTMLFAPSREGISHHPAEHTELADLAACTRALALCMTQLALEA